MEACVFWVAASLSLFLRHATLGSLRMHAATHVIEQGRVESHEITSKDRSKYDEVKE